MADHPVEQAGQQKQLHEQLSSQHPPKPKMTLNDGHKNSRDLETYVLYVGTYALLATFTSFGNRQVESV